MNRNARVAADAADYPLPDEFHEDEIEDKVEPKVEVQKNPLDEYQSVMGALIQAISYATNNVEIVTIESSFTAKGGEYNKYSATVREMRRIKIDPRSKLTPDEQIAEVQDQIDQSTMQRAMNMVLEQERNDARLADYESHYEQAPPIEFGGPPQTPPPNEAVWIDEGGLDADGQQGLPQGSPIRRQRVQYAPKAKDRQPGQFWVTQCEIVKRKGNELEFWKTNGRYAEGKLYLGNDNVPAWGTDLEDGKDTVGTFYLAGHVSSERTVHGNYKVELLGVYGREGMAIRAASEGRIMYDHVRSDGS